MMRAKLKSISSPDIDIQTYWPDDESCFGFLIELEIGPESEEGAELFQIIVCTPDWIKENHSDCEIVWGKNMLIVFKYDICMIKLGINRYIDRCIADDWPNIALKLSRFMGWEFEDYV